MENKKPINILAVGYDDRNIFENDFQELRNKLIRNRLNPGINNIFLFSWSNKDYYKKRDNIETEHKKRRIGNRLLYDFLSPILVPLSLRKRGFVPDILWVRDFPMLFSAIFVKIFWKTKVTLFLGSSPRELSKTKRFPVIDYCYQVFSEFFGKYLADFFIANALTTKKYLLDLGVKEKKIVTITTDVIERDREYIEKSRKGEIRERFNIPDSKKILLTVCRLEPEKGIERLIQVFQEIKRDDLTLIIVGDGVLKNDLENKIASEGLEDGVILAGFVNREGIWNYYRDADVFSLLSYSEGSPTVVREAMYMNVPVIGSKIDSIIEYIGENEERGCLWEEEDGAESFNQKINNILNNETIKQKAKDFVIDKLEKNLDINSIYQKKV